MSGAKVAEFRRRLGKQPIKRVLVYSTAPDSALIGYFDVQRVHTTTPSRLWQTYCAGAGIDKQSFFDYFVGAQYGHALVVSHAACFAEPLRLASLGQSWSPPQAFRYVAPSDWQLVRECVSNLGSSRAAA